ncbi:hypothetical protein L1887_49728 [Cichorium endivia]|nr:hypothetical protein L1887_49728 [Cichorium endivia]
MVGVVRLGVEVECSGAQLLDVGDGHVALEPLELVCIAQQAEARREEVEDGGGLADVVPCTAGCVFDIGRVVRLGLLARIGCLGWNADAKYGHSKVRRAYTALLLAREEFGKVGHIVVVLVRNPGFLEAEPDELAATGDVGPVEQSTRKLGEKYGAGARRNDSAAPGSTPEAQKAGCRARRGEALRCSAFRKCVGAVPGACSGRGSGDHTPGRKL